MFYNVARFLCQVFCLMLFGIRTYGVRNVPRRGPVILASTHQSYLDPVLVQVGLPRSASIMARESLFRNRLFGALIRSLKAFPVERASADYGAMREAVSRLKSGEMLLLFPEATRTPDGSIRRLSPGLGILARRSDAVVVPVTIDGAFECWPRGRAMFRPGRIRVAYGKPMRFTSTRRDALERFAEELRARLVEQQRMLRRIRDGRGAGEQA
jgi:1-acyl-sn-glycerol-3-phosphate acyltransferase